MHRTMTRGLPPGRRMPVNHIPPPFPDRDVTGTWRARASLRIPAYSGCFGACDCVPEAAGAWNEPRPTPLPPARRAHLPTPKRCARNRRRFRARNRRRFRARNRRRFRARNRCARNRQRRARNRRRKRCARNRRRFRPKPPPFRNEAGLTDLGPSPCALRPARWADKNRAAAGPARPVKLWTDGTPVSGLVDWRVLPRTP